MQSDVCGSGSKGGAGGERGGVGCPAHLICSPSKYLEGGHCTVRDNQLSHSGSCESQCHSVTVLKDGENSLILIEQSRAEPNDRCRKVMSMENLTPPN